MKEIVVNEAKDILHLELIEALGLLTTETVANDMDVGEMIISKINSNKGSFKYTIRCEKIVEKKSLFECIKRWFK